MGDTGIISVINDLLIDNIELTIKGKAKKKKSNYIYEREFGSLEEFNNRNKSLKEYKYYIAYGSNLSLAQMDYRCPNSKYEGITYLDNYRLEFRDKFANVVKDNNYRVPVVIYRITSRDEKSLDSYEKDYYKRYIEVPVLGEEKIIKGLIYIMKENKIRDKREIKRIESLPNKNYFNLLRKSYKFFGFNEEILLNSLDKAYRKYYKI